ncbi:MAG: hypothetical protein H0W88_08510 [Parachlamydiaceae bacterium]|nr:hypothetical protein [Parachlamydiaceae bacterium]
MSFVDFNINLSPTNPILDPILVNTRNDQHLDYLTAQYDELRKQGTTEDNRKIEGYIDRNKNGRLQLVPLGYGIGFVGYLDIKKGRVKLHYEPIDPGLLRFTGIVAVKRFIVKDQMDRAVNEIERLDKIINNRLEEVVRIVKLIDKEPNEVERDNLSIDLWYALDTAAIPIAERNIWAKYLEIVDFLYSTLPNTNVPNKNISFDIVKAEQDIDMLSSHPPITVREAHNDLVQIEADIKKLRAEKKQLKEVIASEKDIGSSSHIRDDSLNEKKVVNAELERLRKVRHDLHVAEGKLIRKNRLKKLGKNFI